MNVLEQAGRRWTEAEANEWYAQQPWLVGANYVPSDAINQLEMFQAATFNVEINDRELGWAASIGMNAMRVFLHHLLWEDPDGFKQRLDTFLGIAAKHGIRCLLVLFDSCWEPHPKLGPQHPPIPGVHNSGWVQSPGFEGLTDPSYEPKLREYVTGVVGAFGQDERVFAWDVWNEPDNGTGPSPGGDPWNKNDLVAGLLPKAFAWARSVKPMQPLTSGVWADDGIDPATTQRPVAKIQLAESDFITFHDYSWPEGFEGRIKSLLPLGRPIVCTEYMARGLGSLFDIDLPMAKRYNIGAINWGFVSGKTQTRFPWDSWQRPYVSTEPTVWFHDIFRPDGTPYRLAEVDLLRTLTGRGEGH